MSDRLVELETFVCIVGSQNFVAAAAELGVSCAVVTRRLQSLERRLKVRLINRTTRRIGLTDAGRRYFEFSRRIVKELNEEESVLTKEYNEPKGRITVVSPMSFGIIEMGGAVTDFMVQFPLIEITLVIGDGRRQSYNPGEPGIDIALRFSRPAKTDLHARTLGKIRWILCASPGYLRKVGAPRRIGDLTDHSCLVTTRPFGNGTWKLKGPGGTEKLKVSGVVSPNSAIAMRYMALDGAGIALLPTFCVATDLREGRLVSVLPQYSGMDQPIFACYAAPRQQPLSLRLFVQFLEKRFKHAVWDVGL